MEVKQTWRLSNIDNDEFHIYEKFSELETDCKILLARGNDDIYRITYFEDGEKQEVIKMSVYFNVDKVEE